MQLFVNLTDEALFITSNCFSLALASRNLKRMFGVSKDMLLDVFFVYLQMYFFIVTYCLPCNK